MLLFFGLICICALFALSAFWSGAETALTSLSKYRIKKLIVVNKPLSGPLGQWLRSPYYILTAILVGNTATNLLLSSLATFVAINAFSSVPRNIIELVTWFTVTFLLLLLGEITPKIYSRANPERVTLSSLPLLMRLISVFRPVMWIFAKIQAAFPKTSLFPISKLAYLGLEEVRGLIAEADSAGVMGKDTSQMLERVLNIGELDVSKIMTPTAKVESVNLDQNEDELIDRMVETGRSRVPVYRGSPARIAGFVHTKDLLWIWKSPSGRFSTDLIHPPYFIPPDKKVHELLKEFQSGQTHMAFVTDPLGNLLGVITLEDILERIVGDILDEYDLKKRKK